MGTSGRWAVVVAGGPGDVVLRDPLPPGAFVVAADSGLDRARALRLRVDVAVGDFDSVSPAALDAARAGGVRVESHPREKDATDLELAIDVALASGADRVLVVAGDTGRFDHTIGNLLLLASPRFAAVSMAAVIGAARAAVIRPGDPVELTGVAGDLVSLFAIGGPASGVVTDGLLYPLRGEELGPGSSRGISNELLGARASVRLESGVLLALQPG